MYIYEVRNDDSVTFFLNYSEAKDFSDNDEEITLRAMNERGIFLTEEEPMQIEQNPLKEIMNNEHIVPTDLLNLIDEFRFCRSFFVCDNSIFPIYLFADCEDMIRLCYGYIPGGTDYIFSYLKSLSFQERVILYYLHARIKNQNVNSELSILTGDHDIKHYKAKIGTSYSIGYYNAKFPDELLHLFNRNIDEFFDYEKLSHEIIRQENENQNRNV